MLCHKILHKDLYMIRTAYMFLTLTGKCYKCIEISNEKRTVNVFYGVQTCAPLQE